DQIRLLALDGGGVRGLSSLMILQQLMVTVDPESPPKPCDYFDMIGGTSTGGLIAIMLGRLHMTVDECIDAYTCLSNKVFEKKKHRVTMKGQIQGRFDTAKLERAVKQILSDRSFDPDTLLKDSPNAPCKVFVCATSKQTTNTVCLTSYRSPRGGTHLLNSTKIWQACRATSAATSFFDPITIGPFEEEFVDGALGENNPVYALWNQAQDVWGDQPWGKIQCLVSIGTGIPTLKPVRDEILGIWSTLKELATETEKTAEQFRRDKSSLDEQGRYYRFNVDHGLEHVGLEESKKKKEIAAATSRTRMLPFQFADIVWLDRGPYRTVFTLQGMPASDRFVERLSDTAELEGCLLPRGLSRQTRRRIFVLYGLGGIGKTQLAADFARRHQALFSSIFWLDGRSEGQLRRSIAGYAHRIPQGQIPDRSRNFVTDSADSLNIAVSDVLDWLGRPDNRHWLLIFDNVDQDYEHDGATGAYDIRHYLPGDHGSVLITTRLAWLAQLGGSKRLTKVDEELGKTIFEQWYGRELVIDKTGRELLSLLDGLPLALAQAASYLRETELDTSSYVRLYKQQWDDLIRSDDEYGTSLIDYQRSIGTTWMISFKMIEGESKNAANLLRLWAFLDNKDLWYGLLHAVTDGQEQWPKWLSEIASDEINFLRAARLLRRYSMIESQEAVLGSYELHPVVHRWASYIQNSTVKREFLQLAAVIVGLSVPRSSTRGYWILQNRLLPHAETCLLWIQNICEAGWITEDIRFTHSIHEFGRLYYDQGKLAEVEEIYQRALAGYEKILGPDHTSTLGTVNNLGALYRDQGKLAEAEEMYERALAGYKKALDPEHTDTLGAVNNLGNLYRDQGKLAEAEEMYQRALAGYEKTLSLEHADTLGTVNNLGNLYSDQGKLAEAEEMYERALAGYEKALGPEHTATLTAVNNLGLLYCRQGKLADAEEMYQRVLAGREKILSPEHTDTLGTVNNLGILYCGQGKLAEAEEMYQRALAGYEKALGPEHKSTLTIVNNLGGLYRGQGKLAEAEEMYQRALAGYQNTLGQSDHLTQRAATRLSALVQSQKPRTRKLSRLLFRK
ncbi:hypothetical protein N7474_007579, partial [Penicillium riverlandense]|uniref:uncharacterized protein n=1 Tax=Penicillium riverlandense TaxID=1903569 RepID=UPI002546A49D